MEAALWRYASGRNPKRLRHQVHGFLIRCFYLHRQVMSDLQLTATYADFCRAVLRKEVETATLLLGTHPNPQRMYSLDLAAQWTMLLHWWWAERKGPGLAMVVNPDGEVLPHAQWPDGRVMEDPIIRERREHKDPRYPEWGYQDTMRYYDDHIAKARAEDEAAQKKTKPKRRRNRKRRGKNPFPT